MRHADRRFALGLAAAVAAVVACVGSAAAEAAGDPAAPARPKYSSLRHEEDWSFLRDYEGNYVQLDQRA